MAKELSFGEVLDAIEAKKEIVGRKIVAAMIEDGLFRQDDRRGRIVFVGEQAKPQQMTRIIFDCFVAMLALAYEEEPPRPDLQLLPLGDGP